MVWRDKKNRDKKCTLIFHWSCLLNYRSPYHDRTDEKLSIQVVSPELTGHLPFIAYHYMLDWVFVNLSGSVFWSKDGNQVLK